ncbi:AAA family ATPase [Streptomyces sp. NPDC058045]|uniref:helix-turn-helix transcriptional regulator n=1 Tax=Streptomyces sp. NPDC058045 TaxID=3346311 RepID=UPI0036F0C780
MALADRMTELAWIRDLFERSAQHKAQTVLVEGAVATGKTALLHTFGEEAAADGALVLTATGSRAERGHPLGILGQLCHPFHTAELQSWTEQQPGPQPPPAEAPDAEPAAMAETTARIARGLCTALLEYAAGRPVVLCVDDVQYADRPSLEILLYLLRRLKSERLLTVLSEWTVSPLAHPAFRAELLRHPDCRRISLTSLSEEQVGEVIAEHTDPATAARLAPGYHQVSGGNPLLLRGLLEDAPPTGGGAPPAVPPTEESFRQAVLDCLYRWDQSTVDVARGLAVLEESGGRGDPALVGALTCTNGPRVEADVRALTGARLVHDGRLRHPAIRAAVLDTLTPDARLRLHLRAAGLLYDQGREALEVARHLVAADSTPGGWAVPTLHEAASRALAEDRAEAALDCLSLACRSTEDPAQRAALTMELARISWRRDPSAVLRHLTPLKEAVTAGLLEPPNAIPIALHLFWHGRGQEAQELLDWFTATADTGDPRTASGLSCLGNVRKWLHLSPQLPYATGISGDLPAPTGLAALHDGTTTAGPAEAAGPVLLTASDALGSALAEGLHARAADWAEQTLASTGLSSAGIGDAQFALSALIHTGRTERAAAHCDTLLAEARARRAPTWEALFTSYQAEVALHQGALERAAELAQDALRLISARGWGVVVGHPLSVRILALTSLGRPAEAAGLLRQAVPDGMFHSPFGLCYLRARGHHHLAAGRPRDAFIDFHRCGELMRSWSLDLPELVPWRSDLAQAHLSLGRPEAARDLVTAQLAMPGAHAPRTRGLSLRVLAATEAGNRRTARLREAADLLLGAGDQCELAGVLADLSRAHHELGELSRARAVAHQALQAAAEAGIEDLCRQSLSLRDAAEGLTEDTADGVASLSEAERRVTALAAIGHTNREIARELFITISTVEQHLTRVYRKLNVKQRADLPLRLTGSGRYPPRLVPAAGKSCTG